MEPVVCLDAFQESWLTWKNYALSQYYVHYNNYTLYLVLQEFSCEVADTSSFVWGVATVIGESAKCKQLFESLIGCVKLAVNILGLCPMRLCVHTTAIKHICSSYNTHTKFVERWQEESQRGQQIEGCGTVEPRLKRENIFRSSLVPSAVWTLWGSVPEPAELQSKYPCSKRLPT